jgi:hypothetical protein
MSRVLPISLNARSGIVRLVLACCAAASLAAGAIAPASAATVLNSTGWAGGINLVDTSANPGVTCKFVVSPFSASQQPSLTNIVLSGPTVQPIVLDVKNPTTTPALVLADFRVYGHTIDQDGVATSHLVLSSTNQVLATSPSGTKVPDHAFDARSLSSAWYTAQVMVTYKSTDQSVTYGSRLIGYDFYKSTVSPYLPPLSNLGVGSSC